MMVYPSSKPQAARDAKPSIHEQILEELKAIRAALESK